jgi:hypothetical protein
MDLPDAIPSFLNNRNTRMGIKMVWGHLKGSMKILMGCGVTLLVLGLIYLVISDAFLGARLTPIDIITTGMGFVGIALALNDWKR